jgi:1,4-dihydroxy-2-naphthoyl-CoA hydrolase
MEDPRPGTRPLHRTILGQLALELAEASSERVVMRLPVTDLVRDHDGYLSVGACAVLAEGAASTAAGLAAGPDHRAFGVQLDGSTIARLRDGIATAVAVPLHRGRTIHVWEITISDESGTELHRARCTLAIRSARQA